MDSIKQIGLGLLLLFSSAALHAQNPDLYRNLDSLHTLDQYYIFRLFGITDSHKLDSILQKQLNMGYMAEAVEKLYKYDPVGKDSLNEKRSQMRDSNFKYLKSLMEMGMIKKLDQNHLSAITGLISEFTLKQFNEIDSLLLDLSSKKIIKPVSYANMYDFAHLSHSLPEKYYTAYHFDKNTGNNCLHIPPDIKQTNLYRKVIGLGKWKPDCR
jgi:hypothetical protein